MGVTEDVINAVQAPQTTVIVAVTRKRRVQLEYKLMSTIVGMFVDRARNGTKYTLPNMSVIVVQVAGSQVPDVDTTKWKAKEWKAWITDAEPEEKEDAKTP